jgi:hypothetical protein
MKTKIIIGLLFIAVLGISAGFFLYQKPAEKTVSGKAEFETTAMQLFNEFDTDEALANKKYLNRIIAVRGTISEITAVDSAGLSILLETGNPLFGVSCQLSQAKGKSMLKRGQEVEIRGLCTGKLMDVVLVRCVIETDGKSK